MTTPEWLKPGIYGAAIGAIAISIIGFSWGGWTTSGSADKMAKSMARDEVTSALVPVCLEISRLDPNRVAKLETIRSVKSYARRDAVMKTGWATVPGADSPDRALAQACIDGLELDAS